jgi:uncharacterized repeat protein (TIGR02543 family)
MEGKLSASSVEAREPSPCIPGIPNMDQRLHVIVHPDTISQSIRLIRQAGREREIGGEFVGFLAMPGRAIPDALGKSEKGRRFWAGLQQSGVGAMLVLGSIPPGPNAQMTATSFFPDTAFQACVLDQLQNCHDSEVVRFGTWHSHHSNSLNTFSIRDRANYSETVCGPDYGLDVFLAMLCVDNRGLERLHAEIYQRRHPNCPYRLSGEDISVDALGGYPMRNMQEAIDALEESAYSAVRCSTVPVSFIRSETASPLKMPDNAITHVVTFNSNDGSSCAPWLITITRDQKCPRPTNPARPGYTFAGWFADANFSSLFSFNTPIAEDVALYAKWLKSETETYTVIFNAIGGSYIAPQQVARGQKPRRPEEIPVKPGCVFKDWYADRACTVPFDFDEPAIAPVTVYGWWEILPPRTGAGKTEDDQEFPAP